MGMGYPIEREVINNMGKILEIPVTIEDIPDFGIGYRGTENTLKVIFDFSALLQKFGKGEFLLLFVRPHESDRQPIADITVPVTIEGTKATWTVSDRDTEKSGIGEAQIVYTTAHSRWKSNVWSVAVSRDISERW